MNDCPINLFHVQAGDGAVAKARRQIAALVNELGLPLSGHAVADAQLCTSEIITNALIHAGGECWVQVEWTGNHLKVEVTDRSLRLPVVLTPDYEKGSGRGLALVDSLAYSWGWEPRELGKTVHFLIAADASLTGDERLGALVRRTREKATPPAGAVAAA
ncbi:ATP-binding protein [Kitasatospora kifunensis]|uniref:Anti-sigma regulatory factor (Ser/Thr protein kinase) n=1 Tax=Kitasatospora kifunensis TaxID=58351 RepID=A0A7W7VXA4_KITKI|nr:ATP-binding protein [Kitasatospora kifunensis]MBB4926266.1 anti-sigma regulatory factor (Ser/Thr protein kinase) [Kitasatospora kifunensis]